MPSNNHNFDRRAGDSRETTPAPAAEQAQVAVTIRRLGSLSAFAALELALRGEP